MKKEINANVNSTNSEMKLKTIFFVECGIAVILILILCTRLLINSNHNTKLDETANNVTNESTFTEESFVNIDDSLSASYSNLIMGSFTSEKGHMYTFGTDNVFVGYINEENTNATGTYTISTNGSKTILSLTVENIQKTFDFKFTADGGIELTDEQTNEKILLN